jgi:glycine cleavage system transcriptional repressor
MDTWHMLVVVGRDQVGIVARITRALFEGGASIGEASMLRLGGNFTMMMMVKADDDGSRLEKIIAPVASEMKLTTHIDAIDGQLHRHAQPNVGVSVYGPDRAGIVARVAGTLADAGMNILHLESDVGGTEQRPIYVMRIEGACDRDVAALRAALEPLTHEGMQIHVEDMQIMVG